MRPVPRPAAALSPALPVVAVVALLALPSGAGGAAGAGPADAASALVVLYCAALAVRDRRRPAGPAPALVPRAAAVLFGLPVAAVALSALGAASPGAALTGLGRYTQIFVLVPLAVLLLVRDRRDFRLLAWSLVALAGWQGAVGAHQYVTGTGASYQGADVRAVGTFGAQDVMGMATVVSLGLVCAVGLALGRGPVRHRVVAAGCALLLVVPLALSFSRGAWIATAVTCAAQLLLAGLRRALRAGAAVAAGCVVLVGGFGAGTTMLQERIGSITQVAAAPDQSVTDRYTMWAAAAGMWRERPLTGVGLKGFPEYRDSYASLALSSGSDTAGAGAAYRRQPLLSPHNMYLLVLAEQGLPGLLALAGGWLALLVCGVRAVAGVRGRLGGRRTPGPSPDSGPGLGLDCGLVACGLLVWLLTDFAYADIGGPSTVLTAVCLGLAARWALPGRAGRARPGGTGAAAADGAGASTAAAHAAATDAGAAHVPTGDPAPVATGDAAAASVPAEDAAAARTPVAGAAAAGAR